MERQTSGRQSKRDAFSLVELLLIIALAALLVGVLLPAVQKVREAAGQAQAANNIKQVVLAAHQFANAYSRLPPASEHVYSYDLNWNLSYSNNTFWFNVLPFLDQDALYEKAKVNGTYLASRVATGVVSIYLDPLDFTVGPDGQVPVGVYNYAGSGFQNVDQAACSYTVNAAGLSSGYSVSYAAEPRWSYSSSASVTFAHYSDGLASTMLLSETLASCGLDAAAWYYPQWYSLYDYNATWANGSDFLGSFSRTSVDGQTVENGSPSAAFNLTARECNKYTWTPYSKQPASGRSSMLLGMADGSARTLSSGTSPSTIWKLACLNDGEVPGGDW